MRMIIFAVYNVAIFNYLFYYTKNFTEDPESVDVSLFVMLVGLMKA